MRIANGNLSQNYGRRIDKWSEAVSKKNNFTVFGSEKIDVYIAKKNFRIEKSTFYRNLSYREKNKNNDKFNFTIIFSDIFFTDTSEFADILSRIPILSRKFSYRYASKITHFLTVFYRYQSENKNEIDKWHHFQASPCCGRGLQTVTNARGTKILTKAQRNRIIWQGVFCFGTARCGGEIPYGLDDERESNARAAQTMRRTRCGVWKQQRRCRRRTRPVLTWVRVSGSKRADRVSRWGRRWEKEGGSMH